MNRKIQAFQDFLAMQSIQMPVWDVLINLVIAAVLGYVLSLVYEKCGASLSNRRMFARNFALLAMTTTLVITIVKSSLALSLGLVGALSIVRFRAAIKEPEELMYLFLTISIGLGLGAGQRVLTVLAFVVIVGVIFVRLAASTKLRQQNMFLQITKNEASDQTINLDPVVAILKKYCSKVYLRRYDEFQGKLEAAFLVEIQRFEDLQASKDDLLALDKNLKITYLDQKGLM